MWSSELFATGTVVVRSVANPLTVSGGLVRMQHGSITGTIQLNGGSLEITGGTMGALSQINVAGGTFNLDGGGRMLPANGRATWTSGSVVVGTNTTIGGSLTLGTGRTLTLGAASTTHRVSGTIVVGSGASLSMGPATLFTGSVQVQSGGSISLTCALPSTTTVTLDAGAIITQFVPTSIAGTLSLGAGIALTSFIPLGNTALITGAGNFTLEDAANGASIGTAWLILTDGASFTGGNLITSLNILQTGSVSILGPGSVRVGLAASKWTTVGPVSISIASGAGLAIARADFSSGPSVTNGGLFFNVTSGVCGGVWTGAGLFRAMCSVPAGLNIT